MDMVVKTTLAENVIKLMEDLLEWRPQIEKAMAHVKGMYSFDNVVTSILKNERQFFPFDNCMLIMELNQYPQFSTYHCFLACGTIEAIYAEAEEHVFKIAKELGCKYVSISGRTGWTRVLKDDGWDHVISVLYKEVK